MDVVEAAYGGPLAERDELRARLDGYLRWPAGRDVDRVPAVAAAGTAALAALRAVPCDVPAARERVAALPASRP